MAFDPLSKKNIQCSYKIRKDHFKNKDHKCVFLNLEQFIKKKENLISKNSNELFQKVFFLIGKQNLSISTATSHDFYNSLHEFYEFGQLNPKKELSSFYPLVSRKTFTNNFIINSDLIKSKILKKYIGFASSAIDGGKVGNDSILNCIIINPLKPLKPLLFDGVYHFTGDIESYKSIVSRIIEELDNIGIIITGIVTDNLRAQVITLDHREERSIQKNSDIRALKTVLRIPYQCHAVSLAFNDLKSTIFLDGVERTLQIVIKSFRCKKFKKWIGAICPKICPTRWTNIFDILYFFKNTSKDWPVLLILIILLLEKKLIL